MPIDTIHPHSTPLCQSEFIRCVPNDLFIIDNSYLNYLYMYEMYAQLRQLKAYSRLLMRNCTHGFQVECVVDKIQRVFTLIHTLSGALHYFMEF
jgi:hypothetical protein